MSKESPLGHATRYSDHYDPELLFAIARADGRQALDLDSKLPFSGCDIWNAWELTWLHDSGVPQVAAAEIRVPFDSPRFIESKSLKLYLNSFTMSRYGSADDVRTTIAKDLSDAAGDEIAVKFFDAVSDCTPQPFGGDCIDAIESECDAYHVEASLLGAGDRIVSEQLHSHLLRSLCPVTDQPDFGSVLVSYSGPEIDRASLLRYIVSFRQHNDFHEACVERMFVDIQKRCRPTELTVYARYQRRGGIDINPFRSNFEQTAPNSRLWRQ